MNTSDFLEESRGQLLLALVEASQGGARGEVPVGAVVGGNTGFILAQGANRTLEGSDPLGHAEIRALRQAATRTDNYRLTNATLAISLEPCAICQAAGVEARLGSVQFATFRDPTKVMHQAPISNQTAQAKKPVGLDSSDPLAEACGGMLNFFFEQRRKT
ncbi:MAG: nucleoside deaminase [Magnetococcales bacterium]|nr:nucleoside deaminase [Magnetococcales bacterium]